MTSTRTTSARLSTTSKLASVAASLLALSCSTTNVTNVTELRVLDSGAVATEDASPGQPSAYDGGPPAVVGDDAGLVDGGVDSSDATPSDDGGEDAALDAGESEAACSTSEIPDAWVAAPDQCLPGLAAAGVCPACLPYIYVCPAASYPEELVTGGSDAVMQAVSNMSGTVCANLPLCIASASTTCPTSTLYTCPMLTTGGYLSPPGTCDFLGYGRSCCKP